MDKWVLLCPTDCAPLEGECHYTGGHGKPFKLHCPRGLKSISYKKAEKALKTHTAPPGQGPSNPRRRRYLPHHLTEREKADAGLRRRLSRCIKKVEIRCCGAPTTDYSGCTCNPVAVCRASLK